MDIAVAAYATTVEPFQVRRNASVRTTPALPGEAAAPADQVSISPAARQQAGAVDAAPSASQSDASAASTPGTRPELDETAQRALQSLRQRDQEVRLHEQAHLLAAGPHATGGPSYTYQTGPDGRRYAVGGEVPIDLSAVPGDPQATLQKALTIRRAALAPAHPSSADQAVASRASSLAAQAQQELLETQSAGRLAPQRAAAQAGPGDADAAPEGTSAPAAARHICGPNCQNHGAGPAPQASAPAAGNPLTIVTRALQSYRLAAQSV